MLQITDKVIYKGDISYLRGKKGIITNTSKSIPDNFGLEFLDGTFLWIEERDVEIIEE